MTKYGEYVTEQTVLMRHRPDWAPTIRKFFADAGNNIVQTFYAQDSHLHGYMFHVMTSEQNGISYGLVTGGKAVFEDGERILPTPADEAQIKRQFTHSEWFRFPFSGPLNATPLTLAPEEPEIPD